MSPGGGPAWLAETSAGGWPTRPYRSDRVRCELAVPEGWMTRPALTELPTHAEELFPEGLLLQFMGGADPQADLRGWAAAPIALAGAPAAAVAVGASELLAWDEVEAADVAGRLEVDELRLFEGLARGADLRRIYTVLARRGTEAWHVGLALESACPPGAPEEAVAAHDHVRAAAMLSRLRLG